MAGLPDDGGSSFSPQEILLFAARAARKHLFLSLFITLSIAGLGLTIVSCIPPVYDATCKIFIQESGGVTSTLASGQSHNRPLDGARALDEFILAHDNLAAIVREAKLFDSWPRTRALPMRFKDQIMERLFGPPGRADMERAFVEVLAASIKAAKDGESIRINGQWRDPQNAYDITRLVQRNFLSARASYELGPIQRAIPFLESELAQAEQEVEASVSRIQAASAAEAATEKPATPSAAADKPPATRPGASAELLALSRELSDVRQKLRGLVEPARQRVAELKLELVELQASYSSDHPRVLQQQAKIAAASQSSLDVTKLKQREQELLSAMTTFGVARPEPIATRPGDTVDIAALRAKEQSAVAEIAPLQSRLGAALRKIDDITSRLQGARIELATAEADFQHRYIVVERAEVPSRPMKSKKSVFYAVTVLLSLVFGILAAMLRELRRGRIVEAWQVRALGLELLGEVHLKRLPGEERKS